MCSFAKGSSPRARLLKVGLALLKSMLVSLIVVTLSVSEHSYDQAPILVLPKNRHLILSVLEAWGLLVLGCGVLL